MAQTAIIEASPTDPLEAFVDLWERIGDYAGQLILNFGTSIAGSFPTPVPELMETLEPAHRLHWAEIGDEIDIHPKAVTLSAMAVTTLRGGLSCDPLCGRLLAPLVTS